MTAAMVKTEIPQDVRELAKRFGSHLTEEMRNIISLAVMADRASRASDRDALAKLREAERILDYVATWAWRDSPLTDTERLSAIKYHPSIKARTALAPSVAEPFDKTAFLMSDESLPGTPSPHKGEPDIASEFEAWWATCEYRKRETDTYDLRKILAFQGFVAGRASPPPVAEGMVLWNKRPSNDLSGAQKAWLYDHPNYRSVGKPRVVQFEEWGNLYEDGTYEKMSGSAGTLGKPIDMSRHPLAVAIYAAIPNQADGAGE